MPAGPGAAVTAGQRAGAHPGGAGRPRPLGLRPRERAVHLRNADDPQGPRGRSRALPGNRGRGALHVVLRCQRRAFRDPARRARRGDLRRAESRLDHRRHPAEQGSAAPLRPRRHGRPRARPGGHPGSPVEADRDRRRVLDGRRRRAAGVDLRPRRPLRRARDGGRQPCHRVLRPHRPRHARALWGGRPRRHHHLHPGQGPRRRPAAASRRPAAEITTLLRQRSRPYLFSNTLPPTLVAASLAAPGAPHRVIRARDRLAVNTRWFRRAMAEAGFGVRPGEHPIVVIMLGDAELAHRMAAGLFDEGIYVVGFSYPVVPKDQARIRVQISAAHEQRASRAGGGRVREDRPGSRRDLTGLGRGRS